VSWTINSTSIQSQIQINDTTMQIQFNQNWQGYLYAEIETSCGVLRDSIFLTILNSPGRVQLGMDSSLCPNNTIVLSAGVGYVKYLWQDGSTDPLFNVTSPGKYWVQVIDACNLNSSDTITISPSPTIPFDLGPNLTKCNFDSLTLAAPAGFMNYTWGPDYNIDATEGQSVIIFPSTDTMYKVAAEKTPGCFVFDSIYVDVQNSPRISLGGDTSFCSGNTITLNAGPGFTSYLWNSGQTNSSITVNTAGTFSITATDINNCTSRDTLRVLNVFNNPVVTLPVDSLLCAGSSKTIAGPAGMTFYNWSTGSRANSITVNSTGIYWLSVTDNNKCVGSDTTKIIRLLSLPNDFLPADTTLCSYATMEIAPKKSYSSFLWSTGSTQRSLPVTQTGTYWLRVTDSYGCAGTDTIVVNPKQCAEGFFIPRAFTPNKDGLNDNFRPLLFGVIQHYRFRIYNRWGHVVFESSEPGRGWDGKVLDKETDSNVFVWTCEFQFENQKPTLEKGTVVLIK